MNSFSSFLKEQRKNFENTLAIPTAEQSSTDPVMMQLQLVSQLKKERATIKVCTPNLLIYQK